MSDRQKAFEALKKSLRDVSAPHFYLLNNATVTFKKDETIKASVQRRSDRLHFVWSTGLWDSFTKHERIFETLHLCQHLMSGHFTRLKPKLLDPETKEIAGQAIDLAANHAILKKFQFKDKDLPTIRKEGAFVDTIAPDLALSDDLTAEEYFFALNRKRIQEKEEQEEQEGDADQDSDSEGEEDDTSDDSDKEGGKGKGKGKSKSTAGKKEKKDDAEDDSGADDGDSANEEGDDSDSGDDGEDESDPEDSDDESDADGDSDGDLDGEGEDEDGDSSDDGEGEDEDGDGSDDGEHDPATEGDDESDGDGDDADGDDTEESDGDDSDGDEGEADGEDEADEDASTSLDNHDLSAEGEQDISDLLSEALEALAKNDDEGDEEGDDGYDHGTDGDSGVSEGSRQKATQLMEQAFNLPGGTLAGSGVTGALPPPKIVEDFNPAREWRKFAYKLEKSVRTDQGRTSWTPNKKYAGLHQLNRSGMFLPSYTAPQKAQIRVIVFLDTSGSCVWMASTFMTILASMPQEIFKITSFTFTQFVRPFDVKNPTYKSGGTSFNELEANFDNEVRKDVMAGKNYQHYAFVLTDGEVTQPFQPKTPSQWFFFMYNIYDMHLRVGGEPRSYPDGDMRRTRGRYPSTVRYLPPEAHVHDLEPFLPPAVVDALKGTGSSNVGAAATEYAQKQARQSGVEHKPMVQNGSDWDDTYFAMNQSAPGSISQDPMVQFINRLSGRGYVKP